MRYPKHLLALIEALTRLPGVGNKTAERYAFHLLNWKRAHREEFAGLIDDLDKKIRQCEECGGLCESSLCSFCSNEERKRSGSLCIVANPREIFTIDATGEFKGLFHVLGGLLSPLDGITTETLSIDALLHRVEKYQINEVIIALDSTLEGDATALFIKRALPSINVTRLALGIPMGSSLDYVDGGTLALAFHGRSSL